MAARDRALRPWLSLEQLLDQTLAEETKTDEALTRLAEAKINHADETYDVAKAAYERAEALLVEAAGGAL